MIYGLAPTYDNLRVFGCLAFAHKQRRGGEKFDSLSRKCVFIEYPFGKGWSLFDLDTEEVFVSRDVVFVENTFPLSSETGRGTAEFELFEQAAPRDIDHGVTITPIVEVIEPTTNMIPSTVIVYVSDFDMLQQDSVLMTTGSPLGASETVLVTHTEPVLHSEPAMEPTTKLAIEPATEPGVTQEIQCVEHVEDMGRGKRQNLY